MEVSRSVWAVGILTVALAGGAVLIDRPVLLAGAAFSGAWLVAVTTGFATAVIRVHETIEVDQATPGRRVLTGDTIPVHLTATLPQPAGVRVTIRAGLPITATPDTNPTTTIPAGTARTDHEIPVSWPVAGTFSLDPPIITLESSDGWFRQRLPRGPAPTVRVDPKRPRNIHIGEAGQALLAPHGTFPTGRAGTGIEPRETREYVPGDSARRIDWNATARLNRPLVREFEAETDRTTVLVVDHRATMADGPPGERKLDFARHLALAILDDAREHSFPIGYYGVGEHGTTEGIPPGMTHAIYTRIRNALHPLRPDDPEHLDRTGHGRIAADARHAARRLENDTSEFAARLRPFLLDPTPYRRRVDQDPLFATVRAHVQRLTDPNWTVIITDDRRPGELREAVALARRGNNHVVAYITPTALFADHALTELEAAYDDYVAFESYRRDLASLDRVTAYELAPGERLEAVLAAGRDRRTTPETQP